MKTSPQDQYYIDTEANAFFERNKYDFSKLPDKKKVFFDFFKNYFENKKIENVIEIGCHIGDLLNYMVDELNAQKGFGIEPSSEAVQVGNKQFHERCKILHGTIANTELITKLPNSNLIVVNDVFCWVSRETLFQSIANIDDLLLPGGYLLIRDFLPITQLKNHNRHAGDKEIFCHKIPGSHTSIFTQSGLYKVILSKTFVDDSNTLSKENFDIFENRWTDTLLQKV